MKDTTGWTNPEVLRWARERLNLTVDDVVREAKKLSSKRFATIREEDINAWESGARLPSLAELETLAEIYMCPAGYFFLDSVPEEELPLSFRGLTESEKALSPVTQRCIRRFMELAQWAVRILRESGQPFEVKIRPEQVSPGTCRVDEVVTEMRKQFGWDAKRKEVSQDIDAFGWWRWAIEQRGVFCFELALDPKDARGASLWLEGYPFILVNHKDMEASTGRIFTLLHEFAHLISANDGMVCEFGSTDHEHDAEAFANRFAARMLITPEELMERLRELGKHRYSENWSDALLDKIRTPFFASRHVVAVMLEELGLAPKGFYKEKKQRWEEKYQHWRPFFRGGGRPTLNQQKMQEIGYSLAHLLARTSDYEGFSWFEASLMLGMKVEKTEAFIRWVKSQNL